MTSLLVPRRHVPTRRVSPFSLFSDFDRLFGSGRPSPELASAPAPIAPRIDIHESDEAWLIDAELPGLEQREIEVSVDDGILTIAAEHEESREDEVKGYRHVERYHGSFRRSLRVPEGVEGDSIEATYKNGVLRVAVPKPADAKPEVRNIPVTVD